MSPSESDQKKKEHHWSTSNISGALFLFGQNLDILLAGASESEIFAVFPHEGNIPHRNFLALEKKDHHLFLV